MRKVICAVLCIAAMFWGVFYAFSLGRKQGQDEYFLVNVPTYLFLLLDCRDSIARIPEQVQIDNGIKLEKFDVVLWGLVMAYDARQREIDEAYRRHAKSDRALTAMRRKFARARKITEDMAACVPVLDDRQRK